ncbi:hypothetical protein K504DRAFT_476211 [Pleomassaria siparia CBS 279.74]|uniref:Zn(2)-C6 fungal-type domain-containing protein n=1 Tax=Pleomassaria siparia CBS 279.74 TaxID=1314801 RepID=A0A6G1KBX5_9PLEO|nr:hypothetical protein K504DRAFT_476211 [Pleomassaria siparia CBS 279.74]
MQLSLSLPTKACHNCRKRRWKCDRSLPVCQKCLSSGSDCLGYGKLFVWNHGIASRGKMMGRSYEEREATKNEGQASSKAFSNSNPTSGIFPMESSFLTSNQENMQMTVHRPLVDPLVQDMAYDSRYYLFHFATQLCAEMVTYDVPGNNPVRDLIPVVSDSPLLLQIILANSAFHIFNILREPVETESSTYQDDRRPRLIAHYGGPNRLGGPLKSSYRDALVAKQQALSLLAQSVASVNEHNIDQILVVILLFINYALIESGKDKWMVHMAGARKLIHLLGTPSFQQTPTSKLRKCVLSDFLVFSILGSTLSFTPGPRQLIPDTIELEPILDYAQTNNYLSCPAPLLRIMLRTFELPDGRQCASDELSFEVQEQVRELLEAALSFDPFRWAYTFQPTSPFEDLDKRARIASAHRAAVCIYIARVLSCTNPLLDPSSGSALVSLTGLADEVVHHISHLSPSDNVFKCISWPLFLAGAESEDHIQRMWIMDRLNTLHSIMYWGYIPTVKSVLEVIWTNKDKAGRGADNCWVDEVKEMGTDLLVA